MIVIDFGNDCFNEHSEENILFVIAPKSESSSMDDFVNKVIKFLKSDKTNGDCYDDLEEIYENRTYTPASEKDKEYMKSRIQNMNQKINFIYDDIINAVHIIPPEWNDITLGGETESEYVFCNWSTSA